MATITDLVKVLAPKGLTAAEQKLVRQVVLERGITLAERIETQAAVDQFAPGQPLPGLALVLNPSGLPGTPVSDPSSQFARALRSLERDFLVDGMEGARFVLAQSMSPIEDAMKLGAALLRSSLDDGLKAQQLATLEQQAAARLEALGPKRSSVIEYFDRQRD